ncbi:MAG: acyl carrier protein [Alphaproteobacteria bacterium]|nr:acyl carrier protein [Alphaproteobacteria bacterium]
MDPAVVDHLQRREAILQRLRATLVESLDLRVEPDAIDPDAALFGTGLRLDSIDALELVVAVETEFGVEIADRDGASPDILRTVNTLVDRIQERM